MALAGGYGHYLYTTSSRNGGGGTLGTTATLGHRFAGGFLLGGTLSFEPILQASGSADEGRSSWGPVFIPGGWVAATVGYVGEVVGVDLSVGFGGGGERRSAGGFGLVVSPSVNVSLAAIDEVLHVCVLVRPTLGLLTDPDNPRFLVYLAGSAGVAIGWR